jgi:hypothetical protein
MSILHVMTEDQRLVLAPHVERQAKAVRKAQAALAEAREAEQAVLRAVQALAPQPKGVEWSYNPATGVVSAEEEGS